VSNLRMYGWFSVWFAFCVILALAILGVAVWGFIKLVQWVVAQ